MDKAHIFQWLRARYKDEDQGPINCIQKANGQYVFDPQGMATEVNEQWSTVLCAVDPNDTRATPTEAEFADKFAPAILMLARQGHLQTVEAERLRKTVRNRKKKAARGLCGWTTEEGRMWPLWAWKLWALVLEAIETTTFQWPQIIADGLAPTAHHTMSQPIR